MTERIQYFYNGKQFVGKLTNYPITCQHDTLEGLKFKLKSMLEIWLIQATEMIIHDSFEYVQIDRSQFNPDLTIHSEALSPAFTKHHIKGLPFDLSINEFKAPDTGYPHCHPFDFTTEILSGGYIERVYEPNGNYMDYERKVGDKFHVTAETIHQIIDLPNETCYTLMIPQPHRRISMEWKFENGKVYNKKWSDNEFKEVEI